MKILAIDTSTLVLSVAVLEDHKVLGEKTTNLKKNHSVRLMPAIDELFRDLELSLADIDLFAVTSGPGSYTGVRIGVTTIKTFAYALEKPFIGVSTLKTMAMNGVHFSGLIVPLLDARRKQVYTAVYQAKLSGIHERLTERILSVESLLEELANQPDNVLFLGEDVTLFASEIEQTLGNQVVFAPPLFNLPSASQVGYIACQKWQETEQSEHSDFAPNYLQLTLAEKNLLGRLS